MLLHPLYPSVMENGPSTIGFEDGAMDVEGLLVEPQDGHVSMDSVICFNEKIQENSIDMEGVSRSFGVSKTNISQERQDILRGDVLGTIRNEVEVGYFRLQSDLCSMGDDYLLGVEFTESITNLDYGLSGGLQASISDSSVLESSSIIDTSWKEDPFRIMEMSKGQSDHLNIDSSEFGEISTLCQDSETLIEEKPLQDIGKFHDISSCSFQDILSDENNKSQSPSVEMLCSPKYEKNYEFEPMGSNGDTDRSQELDQSVMISAQSVCTDAFPTQKRSRRPTRRYIDELAESVPRHPKKRREVSSSAFKDKSSGVKDQKKSNVVPRTMRLPSEEPSVKAIQVPFGSLVQKECPKSPVNEIASSSDRGGMLTRSNNNLGYPENKKKEDECSRGGVRVRKRDARGKAAGVKKRDENVPAPFPKKISHVTATHIKKRDYLLPALGWKKWDDSILVESPKRGDGCVAALRQKKREDYLLADSLEEVSGRRKHHRLWTIAEVRKLIDGVSKYGVGRWSRIKKLFFSSSAHRTSVDLKDKWRNLLKASGMQGQGNEQGERKRNLAWRPLPKAILRRVCELAAMHPYPKGQKAAAAMLALTEGGTDMTLSDYKRILRTDAGGEESKPMLALTYHDHDHDHGDSPDRSTDMTLSNYKRILRSINED